MKAKEIARNYGFDLADFSSFLWKQSEVKVIGFNLDVVADEDVAKVISLYNNYLRNEDLHEKQIEQETIKKQLLEQGKISFAKSFNELYEYDVVTILNINHGQINRGKMMEILSTHAKAGWKLHSVYSNELGKNALSILGIGANSTACEDVLIFERRVNAIE